MANITDKVAAIRAATYGSEVRESIASGIEDMNVDAEDALETANAAKSTADSVVAAESVRVAAENNRVIAENERVIELDDAVTAYNTALGISVDAGGLEIAAARGGFDTLGDRVESTDGKVLQTQNKLKPKKLKPIITFSVDDGTVYDLDIMTLFNSKGIVGTTGITYDKIGATNYMTQAQVQSMKDAGWEIASHSKTHSPSDFTTLTEAQLVAEFEGSKELLNNLGFNVKNLFLPFGFTNDTIAKVAARYYRSMRVSGAGATGISNQVPIGTFRLNSFQLGDSTGVGTGTDTNGYVIDSLAQWKYYVDQAVANNYWLVFISHSNNVVLNYNRMADLGALIDYIKSLNVDIMTIDDALNTFDNQVETDKMKIGATGKITGEYGKVRYAPADTVISGTALADIEVAQTTVNVITAGNSSGFVNTSGGTIQTIKPDNEPRKAYQLGKGYGNKVPLYIRDFASDGTPSAWRTLENITNWDDGAIASTHSPSALIKYTLNICYIPTASASGWPEGVAGQLMAYFFSDYGGCYEEYKVRNSDKIYTRYWSAVGAAWSEWSVRHRVTSLTYDSLNASSLLTSFAYGVSYLQITSGNSAGMPSTSAWLLETRRTSPNGFNYQYAHIYNGTETHKRVAKADGTWSSWVKLNA